MSTRQRKNRYLHPFQIDSKGRSFRFPITRALKQISPERADAIALCFFSELTYAEAGRVLKKSESATKMLVSRGLQDLRERTSLAFEVEQ